MMIEEKEKKHNIFLYILLSMVLVTIITSFYSFYYKKNYIFFVETKCNPETDTCFYRDCVGIPDSCPPNNLSYYDQYTIKAKDFHFCLNEDCTEVCKTGKINCTKIKCTETDVKGGVCVTPAPKVEESANIDITI